ncbi:MAG: energy-coupling factor transporter transmembrane component T, partial [Clostridia bacterium]|nr:energy-coupling factor transporter transmembrane component T [Clostridia bacterium]
TFGQFYPGDSFLHKMDPRAKLVLSIVYIATVFLCQTFYSYLAVFGFLLFVVAISGVPAKSVLKSVKGILFLVLITVVINILFYREGKILFKLWIIMITDEGLIFSAKMAMRLLFLVVGTTLITLTTTPMHLTDGMESLMSPLKVLKFPVHDVAIIMSIALRFIPSLMEEIDKIMLAQKARGAAFDTGGLVARAKALLPVLIPLFVSAFRRADELALALDARCYNATPNRTKMKLLRFGYRDAVATLFCAAFMAGIILMKIYLGGML